MPKSPEEELRKLEADGLRRRLRVLTSAQGPIIQCDGRTLHNFSSNDYLGLATHPDLVAAAMAAAAEYGFGSGASRLICGTLPPHVALEESLAAFKGTEAALAFSSGFAAGSGVIPALVGRGDFVVVDKLSHACLIDGARASGATLRVFGHNRLDQLEDLLRQCRARSSEARILVVTEAVFSMDGDLAELEAIVALKDAHDALLLVDEAHSAGVLGPGGRGLSADLGLGHRVDLHMGTLSKALGCHGGFIAARRAIIELLINRARSFIFATAPPPPVAAAATAAIALCLGPEGEARRARLEKNRARLGRLLGWPECPPSAIVPWIIGGESAALDTAAGFYQAGLLVPAIRYPTVPRQSARLRFTVSADHGDEGFAALESALEAVRH